MSVGIKEHTISYLLFLRFIPVIPFWLVNLIPIFFKNDENMQYSGFVNLRETLNEVVNNPRIVQPFYEKIIREQIEKDKITREEC